MVVGVGQMKFRLFEIRSLKQKRKIVKSMIQRIGNTFNISIAEIDLNDSHGWAVIGFSMVGNDARKINSKLDKVMNMADDLGLAMMADSTIEIIHV